MTAADVLCRTCWGQAQVLIEVPHADRGWGGNLRIVCPMCHGKGVVPPGHPAVIRERRALALRLWENEMTDSALATELRMTPTEASRFLFGVVGSELGPSGQAKLEALCARWEVA